MYGSPGSLRARSQQLPPRPCPRASGPIARDALVRLLGGPCGLTSTGHVRVGGPTMRCVSTGGAKDNRSGAWVATRPASAISAAR